MCNRYSLTKCQAAIREIFDTLSDRAENLAPQPAVFPYQAAPIMRNTFEGPELFMARWGMPSPKFALTNRKTDPGVTNIRNIGSPHWRRWLGPEHRCLVPLTSFSEYETTRDGKISDAPYALGPNSISGHYPRTLELELWNRLFPRHLL